MPESKEPTDPLLAIFSEASVRSRRELLMADFRMTTVPLPPELFVAPEADLITISELAVVMRKSAINNSLLDLTDASEKIARRGSVGSLDSGMSISFQSNSIFNNHQCSSQNYHHRSPRVNGESRGPKHNH